MSSKRVGGVAGAIVALLVLGFALMSGPMDHNQAAPANAEHSAVAAPAVTNSVAAAPAAPAAPAAVRRSGGKRAVIRDVPN